MGSYESPIRGRVEEAASPPARKEGRFAKAKYYIRDKEGSGANKPKVYFPSSF